MLSFSCWPRPGRCGFYFEAAEARGACDFSNRDPTMIMHALNNLINGTMAATTAWQCALLLVLATGACSIAAESNSPAAGAVPAAPERPVIIKADPYYTEWGGWELRPLERARRQSDLLVKADFSKEGLARWWLPDGAAAAAKADGVLVSLSPAAAASGSTWGILWFKMPVYAPFAVEAEFTLDPSCPHDANFFWGQNAPSMKNLGREQECFLAGFFGWGGRACGIERTSDWQTFGITGALEPQPGVRRTGIWIVDGRTQSMYLDGTLALYARTDEMPPLSGYFGIGVCMSRVTFHSLKIYRLKSIRK